METGYDGDAENATQTPGMEHLNYGMPQLRCTETVKYAPNFKDFVLGKGRQYFINYYVEVMLKQYYF